LGVSEITHQGDIVKTPSILLFLLAGTAAAADELNIGGTTDYDTQGAGVIVEYNFGDLSPDQQWAGGATAFARLDADGDGFIGLGYMGRHRFDERLFLDLSFTPGLYLEGEIDLGSVLNFRSAIGIGLDLTETSFVSFGIDHFSNGGLSDRNPGAESFVLRYGLRF
jgi:hypothetical protein